MNLIDKTQDEKTNHAAKLIEQELFDALAVEDFSESQTPKSLRQTLKEVSEHAVKRLIQEEDEATETYQANRNTLRKVAEDEITYLKSQIKQFEDNCGEITRKLYIDQKIMAEVYYEQVTQIKALVDAQRRVLSVV